MVLLHALSSAEHISDVYALSVHLLCAQFFWDHVRTVLKPNPAFVPKVPGVMFPWWLFDLAAFTVSMDKQHVHTLCGANVHGQDQVFKLEESALCLMGWSPQRQTSYKATIWWGRSFWLV